MRSFVVAAAVIFMTIDPISAAENSARPSSSFFRTDTGRAVSVKSLDEALSGSSVIGRLATGDITRFLGVAVKSDSGGTILLGATADMVYAASLKGAIRADDAEAGPGQLILWQPGADTPVSYDFDVKRLFATLSVDLKPGLQKTLDDLIARQDRQKFWGALQAVQLNIQALRTPIIEPVRRSYLRRPAVMSLRLRHRTMAELARGVAAKFVDALREGDAGTVADLLDPTLFVAKGGSVASDDWQPVRRAFAKRLAGQKWRARLAAGDRLQATGNAAIWYAAGAPTGFSVTLGAFDGMPFVRSVKSAAAPAKKEQSL